MQHTNNKKQWAVWRIKKKKRKTDHHVIGTGDSMPQKNVEVENEKTLGDDEV